MSSRSRDPRHPGSGRGELQCRRLAPPSKWTVRDKLSVAAGALVAMLAYFFSHHSQGSQATGAVSPRLESWKVEFGVHDDQMSKLRFMTSKSSLRWGRKLGNHTLRKFRGPIIDAKISAANEVIGVSFALRGSIDVIGYAVLRSYAKWVMIVGVFVALSLRTSGFNHSHEEIGSKCSHSVEICQESELDTDLPDDDQQDDKSCPPDHEHHGCCNAALPLIGDSNFICRLGVPGSSLLGVRHEGEVPPEGPFLASEKPPLI